MRPEQWLRARTILELAASRPPSERVRCVSDHCSDDEELRTEIESLLGRYAESPELALILRSPYPPTLGLETTAVATREARSDDSQMTRTASAAQDSPTWGEFVLLEELGRGGFGIVHRAWDPGLKREVALKVIDTRRVSGGDRLLYEGQLLARISHAHVVRVHSAVRIGDQVGLVMELITGRTLASFIAEHGPMSCAEAAVTGVSLCDALSAVHHLGLVHRDVKSSNVMRESGGRIVLMDFGAGRDRTDRPAGRPDLVGTPSYTAPELLFGGDPTPASDIYSLGVLLYYLVTGRHPVPGRSFDDVRQAHLQGERIPLAECRADLPSAFVAVVERALSRDPSERYQNPQQLKQDLLKVTAASEPPPAAVSGPAGPRPHRRPWLQALLIGLPAALVVCGLLGFVETAFLNLTLDRRGGFGSEPLLAHVYYGAQSLVAPLTYMGLAVLCFNAAALAVRILGTLLPPLGRFVARRRDGIRRRLQLIGLADPNTFLQAMCAAALFVLIVHCWVFADLITAYAGVANAALAPASALEILSTPRIALHSAYHVVLAALILSLAVGLTLAARAASRRQTTLKAGGVAGVGALLAIALVLMAGPWRILFDDTFRAIDLDGGHCFIIGETSGELLLHCPDRRPSRNLVIRRDDPRIPTTFNYGNLFDAYAAAPLPPR
jgi:serine/threonine protein kinase